MRPHLWAPYYQAVRLTGLGRPLGSIAVAIIGVAAATVVITALEQVLGVPNAAAVYLVAVSAVAIAVGTGGAVLAAVIAILVYDFLFTNPLHTLTVADPGELLNLVLLLFVAVTVGQLASLQRGRAEIAEAREREARALVDVTRLLAGRSSTLDVLGEIAAVLVHEPGMDRVWVSLGSDDAAERIVTDTDGGEPPRRAGAYAVLHRQSGSRPTAWTQIREAGAREAGNAGTARASGDGGTVRDPAPVFVSAARERRIRVRIELGGRVLGSIWAIRPERAGMPGSATSRLLAVTAEQVALALEHDRLEAEARQAEIARQSDQLKSALLDSVSHDLRTPLASIRTYAGTLMDEDVRLSPVETRQSAAAIDREAMRLNRIVANLLDLSRIEGGGLRPRREMLDLDDVVERAVSQVGPRLGERKVRVSMPSGLAVTGDPVLLDEALVNLIENVAVHTPDGTPVAVSARSIGGDIVRLTVEDAGPGVPRDALPHLFEKFYQARPGEPLTAGGVGSAGPAATPRRRQGTGIGLAVVRGLAEALGGKASARISQLGGLAVDLDLPVAAEATSPLEVAR